MSQLQSKTVLITGAGSGVGRATALLFAREWALAVVIADVDEAGGRETAAQVEAAGSEALYVHADVTNAGEVEALVRAAVQTYGRLDGAVNNAGIEGVYRPLHDYPDDVFDQVIQVNLKGVWLCLKAEIRTMLAQGGGVIVNTASVAGLIGAPLLSAYDASKHGVVGLTKTAAVEYARAGIRVNAVCPAFTRTPMIERTLAAEPGLEKRLTTAQPMGRMGTADEVAAAIVWLLSDAAAFVTGHALTIDGGLVAL